MVGELGVSETRAAAAAFDWERVVTMVCDCYSVCEFQKIDL